MIEGSEYIQANELLNLIDPRDIYKYYLGYTPINRKLYLSPFRPDNNASFGIFGGGKYGLLHKDFGDDRYKGNCINFVEQLFNLSYREAVHKIIEDFKPNRSIIIRPTLYVKAEKTQIQIIPRPFTQTDINYWYGYEISTDDLIAENVYSVKRLFINKQYIHTDDLCFAYLFIDGEEEYLKIYQPLSKTSKWLSNVPVKHPFGLDKLERKSNIVVIAKSKKDKLVLRKLITDVYETQKEGTEVITEEVDAFFDLNYDRKVCFFDNDSAGKQANIGLNPLGYGWINVPNKYYQEGIKDPSDLVKAYGYDVLRQLLVDKELIL